MEEKQTPSVTATYQSAPAPKSRPVKDTLHSKRVWGFLVLVLFFIGVGTTVPVGKIPFLRSLVMAMGYSQEDTLRLTLFDALFTWNENRKMAQREKPQPGEIAVFNQAEAAARRARGSQVAAQNGLINFNAINAQLRKQGKSVEQITGDVGAIDEDNPSRAQVQLNNPNASTATDANQAQVSDVYFGSDVNLSPRDKTDGYNSVNSLKRASSGRNIVSMGNQQSWLLQMIDKAFESDSELHDLEQSLSVSSLASGLGALKAPGETKSSRDMYWAWLMGRAARRTPNVILKKTLATTSFDGAEVPKTVFNEFGFGGVGINAEDLQLDADAAQKLLEEQLKCKASMTGYNKENSYASFYNNISGAVTSLKDSLSGLTCGNYSSTNSSVTTSVGTITGNCKEIQKMYTTIGEHCRLTVQTPTEVCEGRGETNLVTAFKENYCGEEPAECTEGAPTYNEKTCKAWKGKSIQEALRDPESDVKLGGPNGNDIEKWVSDYFEGGKVGEGKLSSAYFPTPDWGSTFSSLGGGELGQ